MKRSIVLIALFSLLVVMAAGCALPGQYGTGRPGGAAPSFVYSSVTYPADNTSTTRYNIDRDDFEIIGPVEGRGSSTQVLILFTWGESGYKKCLEAARAMGADDIINLRVDLHYTYCLGIFATVETIVTGTAIKWKT